MFLVTLRTQYGRPWFSKLAANAPDIYASKAPLFERLSAGEYALMDQGSVGTLSDYYLKGAPIRWSFPTPTPIAMTSCTRRLLDPLMPQPGASPDSSCSGGNTK